MMKGDKNIILQNLIQFLRIAVLLLWVEKNEKRNFPLWVIRPCLLDEAVLIF